MFALDGRGPIREPLVRRPGGQPSVTTAENFGDIHFQRRRLPLDDFVGSMIIDQAGNLWFGHPGSFPDGKGGGARKPI